MVVVESKYGREEFTPKKQIEVAGEKEAQEALGLSDEAFAEWKYNQAVKFLAPGSADVVIRAHGQNIEHHSVHYSDNLFKTAILNSNGTIESDPPVTGWVDCLQQFGIPQLRQAIRHHRYDDEHSVEKQNGVHPLESNIVIDYANEFGNRMRKTFVDGRFTKIESDIELYDAVFVDRYHFTASDIVTEVFVDGQNGCEVVMSDKTSMVGVIGG